MKKLSFALLLAAGTILAGCKSNDSKPEDTAAAPAPASASATQPAATPAKPECPPEPTTKKKTSTKSKTAKKTDTPPADCEPAKPKSASTAKTSEPAKPEAAATAVTGGTAGKACNPCAMKSKDGTFDGEVYGTIPPGSKWAKLQIGMHQSEVERILGVTSNIRAYVTAKAWIPFYFGGDSHRYEAVYAGQGSVAYTGGSWGGGQGILMMINYDPKIQ
uniref:Lipoprotein n=1 Tax=Dechloromonas aromatica (strain RCB) TaxID=159087 RepID=Q47A12_DECAR